jgi:alpha-L-rhamnosidase-like protein/mannosylglycerate hydrolase MGH1-like protein
MTRALLLAAVLVAVAAAPASAENDDWKDYVLAPSSRDVAPVRVVSAAPGGGVVEHADGALRRDGRSLTLRKTFADSDPRVVLDLGREVGGHLEVDFDGAGANTLFAFSESLAYMRDLGDTFGSTSFIANDDRALPQRERRFESPHEHAPAGRERWRDPELRGGLRYVMVRLAPEAPAGASVSIDAVHLRYTPMPGYDLRDREALLPGHFLSSDEGLNRIWYAGANTLHVGTIDPREGIENGTETIGVGERVLVDGAKRDRLVWNGDLAITGRIAAVSTFDMQAWRDSLRSISRHQRADGYLTACSPNGLGGPVCQGFLEYHLWWLTGLEEYWLYSGDRAFVDEQWTAFVRAMDYLESRQSTGGSEGTDQQNAAPRVPAGGTLGQSFTTDKRFTSVAGRFPTYNTADADVTLSLYRDGPGGQQLARRRIEDVPDNSWQALDFAEPLEPGTYYLEQSEPSGSIAWWSHTDDVYPAGEAFENGQAVAGDRTLRIATVEQRPPLLDLGDQGGHWIYGDAGRETEVNALYVQVLRDAAELAALEGADERAREWRDTAPQIAAGINDELWDPGKGAYRQSSVNPGNVPQDGNVLAVLAGVPDRERTTASLDYLKAALWTPYGSRTGTGSMPQLVGPFMNYYEALARFDTGRDAEAWELLRRVWGYMHLDTKVIEGVSEPPATAAWEHIELDGRPYRFEDGSLAHPWSAGATALLTNEVLGVRPVAPGYRRFVVEPHPGDVRWAEGRVPTPHGPIDVRWRQKAGGLQIHVDAPRGTRGTVVLPGGDKKEIGP